MPDLEPEVKSKIPNHPKHCKGVKDAYYSVDQCRLCWLATYDAKMRKKWGIVGPSQPANILTPETTYPCRFRGTERILAPGCGGCSGLTHLNSCNSTNTNVQLCYVDDLGKGASTARSHGYGICSECGWREPKEGLEPSVPRMIQLLNEPPSSLPEGFETLESTHYAFQTLFREQCLANHRPPSQKKTKGRGIVIGAGGETYFKNAWVVAHRLRQLDCFLPIQFWYLGWREMDSIMINACRRVGIECVDAEMVANSLERPPRILNGWELKPFSVIHSPFREVLYLDADSIPAVNPNYLFDSSEYLSTGSIFWPDLPPSHKPQWIPDDVWRLYGQTVDTTPDFESGQFIVDKVRCWAELQVTMWLNEHSDFVYRHVYGDKSTYHLAWRGCGTDYTLPAKLPTWMSPAIQQYDCNGNLAFQHCCQGKALLANGLRIPSLVNPGVAVEAIGLLKEYVGDHHLYKPTIPPPFKKCWLVGPEFSLDLELHPGGLLKGNPPILKRWGMFGSNLVLVGVKGRANNPIVLDRLTNQNNEWVGETYRLTQCEP